MGVGSLMFSRRSISTSRITAISLSIILITFSLNISDKSIASTVVYGHITSQTMALPPRAYAERQQLSPIRIKGVIQQVTCGNNRCLVKMYVKSIKRNRSSRPLTKGDVITIIDIEVSDSQTESRPPDQQQAPMIGLPNNSVHIPPICSRTEAWLRPAEPSNDRNHFNTYQLMAGPFGFGPSLED